MTPPEYFWRRGMKKIADLTDVEKITVMASELIKSDKALQKSQTRKEEEKAIKRIEHCLEVFSNTEVINQSYPLIRKLEIKLQRLKNGKITKQQFSCQELSDRIVLVAVEQTGGIAD